jgi:uncharacterized protein DUF4375
MPSPDYIEFIGDAFHTVDIYGSYETYLAGLRAYPGPVQYMLACVLCMGQIDNGGIDQFFSNSAGIVAPEAVVGFRALGLPETAAVIEEAMMRLGTPYPRDRDERNRRLYEKRPEHEPPTFDDLDDQFHNSMTEFSETADAYAARHC